MKKRRSFSLIEVIIAFALSAVLIALLMNFYFQATSLSKGTKDAFWPVYQRSHLHQKLLHTLSKVSMRDSSKGYLFLSPLEDGHNSSSSLVFTFDNGIDSNPLFSADILGRLYIDNHQRLILATWPSPLRWKLHPQEIPSRQEIICEGVRKVGFSFYQFPDQDKPSSSPELQGWVASWDQTKKSLPAMIRIELEFSSLQPFQETYILEYAEKYPTFTKVP